MLGRNREAMQARAPEGHEAIVEVRLIGRAEPVVLSKVETVRGRPWVLLHSYGPEQDPEKSDPQDVLLLTHDQHIGHVEVSYRKVGKAPVGFEVVLRADDALNVDS